MHTYGKNDVFLELRAESEADSHVQSSILT